MRRSAPRVTSLNTSHFMLSAQAATLVHSTEVDACLCNATTPWKQGDFRLKLHASDVTMNSFYCLDNQSVDEFICCLCFVAALVKTLRSENCVKNREMKMFCAGDCRGSVSSNLVAVYEKLFDSFVVYAANVGV